MVTNYPVGDFLIKVKNAVMARKKELDVASTKEMAAVAETLKRMGYLTDIKKGKEGILMAFAYKAKRPVLLDLRLISKPGLRIYAGASEIAAKRGPSVFLVSTPKGILSSKEAIGKRVGGELIAEIW